MSVTLDTGALVAIERRKQRGNQLLQLALVMAFAASRGDVVFTADPKDSERLPRFLPSVRVLSCGDEP